MKVYPEYLFFALQMQCPAFFMLSFDALSSPFALWRLVDSRVLETMEGIQSKGGELAAYSQALCLLAVVCVGLSFFPKAPAIFSFQF